MLYIHCPYCEEHRSEEEFHYKGQAHIARPDDPDNCTDVEWADFIYRRDNPRGEHKEQWYHTVGCRKFFNAIRDTQSYEIKTTYKVGEQPDMAAGIVTGQQGSNAS
jgi:sarcosine oxidase subunit delta